MKRARRPGGYVTFRAYCLCGASFTGRLTGQHPAVEEERLERFMDEWWDTHEGPDCGPTDARGAARGRARTEPRS